jgi:hypothetical protein
MKKMILLLLSAGMIMIAIGQSKTDENLENIENIGNQKKCSSVVEGLQFCTSTSNISVKSGEGVRLGLSFQNMSPENISIVNGGFKEFYNVTVTDSNGRRIYSYSEELDKRANEGKATMKELIEALPVGSVAKSITLAPKEELKIEINLSQFYDLKAKGKYSVKMSRKIAKKCEGGIAEISFGDIAIEVI